jgi:outer membrane biosynthesis protein TonB
MMVGIPPDVRRTAVVSLVGHIMLLLILAFVPHMKVPARDAGSYQVVLVSPASLRQSTKHTQAAPASEVSKPSPTPPLQKQDAPSPVKPELPVPPMEKMAVRSPQPLPKTSFSAVRPEPVAPPAPVVAKPDRLTDLLHQNMREIAVPKEVSPASPQTPQTPIVPKSVKSIEPVQTPQSAPLLEAFHRPDVPADSIPPKESPIQLPRQEVSSKPAPDRALMDALKKAEETLNKPVTQASAAPKMPVASSKPSRTSEEVMRELNQLSVPKALGPVMPSPKETERAQPAAPQPTFRDEVSRMLAHARPVPSLETQVRPPATNPSAPEAPARPESAVAAAGASRAATLERCPPRAKNYCPLLEAAINRLWNADYNPALRRMLESAGDSATLMMIEIRPDGIIQNIAVAESSGNKGYDLAIQSLLREQKQFPPLPEELKGENFKAITTFKYTRKI